MDEHPPPARRRSNDQTSCSGYSGDPSWREARAELNALPLSAEEWNE